jgi:hypothetical protein
MAARHARLQVEKESAAGERVVGRRKETGGGGERWGLYIRGVVVSWCCYGYKQNLAINMSRRENRRATCTVGRFIDLVCP